ncbi:MAG: hypothetical protein Q9222_004819, partial [Ikaeria aurantiellina]
MSRKIYTQELQAAARREARSRQGNRDWSDNLRHDDNDPLVKDDDNVDFMEALEWVREVVKRAWDTALLPFHAAVSKPAQKAYLGTFLFATTSLFLLCVSTVAYIIFYYSLVPDVSVERGVGLQFG